MRPRPLKHLFLQALALIALPVALLTAAYVWCGLARTPGAPFDSLRNTAPALLIIALGWAATLVLALVAARRLSGLLAQLTAAAEAIGRREFRLAIPAPGPVEEVNRLAAAIREMAEWVGASLAAAETAREEAERQRRMLEAVLEAMPIGVSIVEGPTPQVRRRNRIADAILGGPVPSGTPLAEVGQRVPMLGENGRPMAIEARPSMRALAGETCRNLEVRIADGRGGTRMIRVHAAPIPAGPSDPPRAVVIYEDVTERAELRSRLTHAERLSSLGTLVAGLAHELNNPLTGIIGFSDLLLAGLLPEETRAKVELIQREAGRAARIVRNLLTFARAHDGERGPIDLRVVVERTLELRAHELRTRGITVHVEIPPEGLPPVRADQQQLQQVLLNLLLNAEQALKGEPRAEPGQIWIRGRAIGASARIEVEDNGPGIPVENLSRIFDPFFTTKPAGIGTGLGLSVSHGIVEAHGGRIWAESRAGGGARLVVELPAEAGGKTAGT